MTKGEYDKKRGNTYQDRLERKRELENKAICDTLSPVDMIELMACPSCGMMGQFHFDWCDELDL